VRLEPVRKASVGAGRDEERGARGEERGARGEGRGAREEERGTRSEDEGRGAREEERGARDEGEERGARDDRLPATGYRLPAASRRSTVDGRRSTEKIRGQQPAVSSHLLGVSGQRVAHLALTEPACQHHDTVEDHDGDAVAVPLLPWGAIDVDRLECVAGPCRRAFHDGTHMITQRAPLPREEDHRHRGIVRRHMRPATVLALVVLLVMIAVAGIAFVIRLVSLG
jgi:hypothetical protein